ncbi:MAG: hypothetical protein KDD58_07345 [Bdellovibrionales bacterium]|nr:hypothetical protein [Bdellovibrionales bacterium]
MSFSLVSCSNILREFAKKDTDEALLYEAKKNMNDGEWTAAIANFDSMSASFLKKRDVVLQHAKAYAGRCGLDLLQLFEDLSSNLSSGRLYPLLMSAFTNATTTNVDDCGEAENLLISIAASADNRTSEENTTLAFISFAKLGTIFSAFADESTADGSTDGDFNACQDNQTPGIPEAYVREVGISIAIASVSLTAAIAEGGLSGGDELNSISSVCSALDDLSTATGLDLNFCDQTDPNSLTSEQVKAIRWTMIDNQVIGLGGATSCDLSETALVATNCGVVCPP